MPIAKPIDSANCQSVVALFMAQAGQKGDAPFLWAKREGAWIARSWAEVRADILDLAVGLRTLGLQRGDRVMLVSENRPEWVVADLAIMAAGGITVPAYTTNTASDHLHVLNNSGARFVIASTRQLTEKVMAAGWQATTPPTVIAIQPPDLRQSSGVGLISWDDTLRLGRAGDNGLAETMAALRRDHTACIIYTSGTGGAPKGVMLSHGALIVNAAGAEKVLEPITDGNDVFLSFLPLSHAYEHLAGLIFPILVGAQIYYAESIEALGANMAEVHPTIMTAVPRLYETLRGRILHGLQRQGGLKKTLFMKAVELGSKRYVKGRLGPVDSLADAALDRLVRSKVQERFGGRLKALVSGGAPLSYEVGLFFTALGVRILQGYGQTEAAPVISVNLPGKVKLDTVGPAMACNEVRIGADGEILVRGENIMQGYWNDPGATAQVLRDGWLATGDIAERDADGFYWIRGRLKDMYISGGENVYPAEVENVLHQMTAIAEAAVIGIADAQWGEVGLAIVAVKPGQRLTEADVFAHCAANLARFKCPRQVRFVDALPRNATGKIHKPTLRKDFSVASEADKARAATA